MWNFADLFYYNQQDETTTYVTNQFLRRIGAGVPGLNVNQALAARDGNDITQQLTQSSSEFNAGGFSGTPSFAIGKGNGTLTQFNPASFTDPSSYEQAIDKALGSSGS
jgi:hypothetical protein